MSMVLTDREIKDMLKDYYKMDVKINKITAEIKRADTDAQDIIESLTLTSQRLSGMPLTHNNTSPVERIYEEYEKIIKEYKDNAIRWRTELEQAYKKQRAYSQWIGQAKLNETEQKVIEYIGKYGLKDWQIGIKISYSCRMTDYYIRSAYDKLKKIKGGIL